MRWRLCSLGGVSVAKQRFEDFSKELPFRLRRMGPAVTERLQAFAKALEARLKRAAPKRTGAMAERIRVHLDYKGRKSDGSHWPIGAIRIEIDDPAANALEQGGTVRGDPWLAIPLRRELERFSGPRETGRYFSVQTLDGRIYLAKSEGGRANFYYRLKTSVFLEKRPFIMETVRKVAPGFRDGLLRDGREILNPGRGPGVSTYRR